MKNTDSFSAVLGSLGQIPLAYQKPWCHGTKPGISTKLAPDTKARKQRQEPGEKKHHIFEIVDLTTKTRLQMGCSGSRCCFSIDGEPSGTRSHVTWHPPRHMFHFRVSGARAYPTDQLAFCVRQCRKLEKLIFHFPA